MTSTTRRHLLRRGWEGIDQVVRSSKDLAAMVRQAGSEDKAEI
ncbi:hypothetical protein [Streptomyces niphimycinicus]|nr:hypothetical protein [Streptomyces niphimycinicus]